MASRKEDEQALRAELDKAQTLRGDEKAWKAQAAAVAAAGAQAQKHWGKR